MYSLSWRRIVDPTIPVAVIVQYCQRYIPTKRITYSFVCIRIKNETTLQPGLLLLRKLAPSMSSSALRTRSIVLSVQIMRRSWLQRGVDIASISLMKHPLLHMYHSTARRCPNLRVFVSSLGRPKVFYRTSYSGTTPNSQDGHARRYLEDIESFRHLAHDFVLRGGIHRATRMSREARRTRCVHHRHPAGHVGSLNRSSCPYPSCLAGLLSEEAWPAQTWRT